MGLAKLQMQQDLGFSETVYGLGAGLFFVGYILFEVPSNLVLARMGARLWIARIMITWGLISGATMFVSTPMQFYVLRFLLGVAEAGFFPGVMLYLTYWYPTRMRSKIMALFLIGLPLASLVGAPLSGWIMTAFAGVRGHAGWQWLFFLEAIPSVVLGLLVFVYLPNSIESAQWLSPRDKGVLRANLDSDRLAESHHSAVGGVVQRPGLAAGHDRPEPDDVHLCHQLLAAHHHPRGRGQEHGRDRPAHGRSQCLCHRCAAAQRHQLRPAPRAALAHRAAGTGGRGRHGAEHAVHRPCVRHRAAVLSGDGGHHGRLSVFWCLPATFLTGPAAAAGIALIASIANLGGFAATYLLGWLKDLTHSSSAGLLLFAACLVAGSLLTLALPKAVVNR